jgi:hypothetical protein
MPVEKITGTHRLSDYLVLYDKETMKPILDPCFSEFLMTFVCGHEKTMFRREYTMEDQYCQECKAMRSIRTFEFTGVKTEDLDHDRTLQIQIKLQEWNPETKIGTYLLCKPKKMPNGKYIATIDHMAAPGFTTFSESEKEEAKEEKWAEYPTANYNDQKALTVFEVPEWALKVPDIVMHDTKAYLMVDKGQKSDGTFQWERKEELSHKSLVIPEQKSV